MIALAAPPPKNSHAASKMRSWPRCFGEAGKLCALAHRAGLVDLFVQLDFSSPNAVPCSRGRERRQLEMQVQDFIARLDAFRAVVREQLIECRPRCIEVGIQFAIIFDEVRGLMTEAKVDCLQLVDDREHLVPSPLIAHTARDCLAQVLAVPFYGLLAG